MLNVRPVEYISVYDSGNVPAPVTSWTLTSPDSTVYGPTITTGGVVSFASGATAAGTAVIFLGLDGTGWTPSIANGGVVTLTQGGALSNANNEAHLTDSGGTVWSFYIGDDGQARVTTANLLPQLVRYPSLVFSYTPSQSADYCLVHSARLNMTIRRGVS